MLEYINTDILILVGLTAVAGALSSVLMSKWISRRNAKDRKQWAAEDQQRIDEINQTLKGGRDA